MARKYKYRKPHRYKKKKPILKKRFFWLGFLIIIAAAAVFYCLFFLEVFQVKKIIISSPDKVSKEEIEFLVEQRLESKILFFETRSIFAADLNQIMKDILNYFPQIAEAKVSLGLFDVVKVEVIERQALAQWCNQGCFLIDKEGIIFEEVFEVRPDLIVVRTEAGSGELGETVIEKKSLAQILDIKSKAEGVGVPIEEAFLASEERLNMKTIEGWEIYFNLEKDLGWQITELKEILKEKIPQEKRDKLDYIDLRFSRVYYTYKK